MSFMCRFLDILPIISYSYMIWYEAKGEAVSIMIAWRIIFLETELQEDISGGNTNLFKKGPYFFL